MNKYQWVYLLKKIRDKDVGAENRKQILRLGDFDYNVPLQKNQI